MKQNMYIWAMVSTLSSASVAAQTATWQTKISPALGDATEQGCWVLLSEQAQTHRQAGYYTKEEKGQYVFQQLQNTALHSQGELRVWLDQQAVSYIPHWIVNSIFLPQADPSLVEALAQRADVHRILPNAPIRSLDPVDQSPIESGQTAGALRDGSPEWGIVKIQADRLWSVGIRGAGAVIGGQDTGYDWDHPALQSAYRGWNGTIADHHYHWHDAIHGKHDLNFDTLNPCGFDAQTPCDDGSHGTHTMGTMVGGTGDDIIGVAPAARWIGCRNMERGWGTPQTYIECFQWFLAPTDLNGNNPNPNMAPHVVNNSWSCPTIEGCNPDNFEMMRLAIAHLRDAGVVVVVSAGNDGPACNTVKNPAPIFAESFSIGALNSADTMAAFSSRGLVTADESGRMKPNVAAPGVGVRSCVPNGYYATYSGTSMAGPHVAGLVALLIHAAPELAGQVERIEEILEQTAIPVHSDQVCDGIAGNAIPNPISGYGRVDAWEALAIVRPDLVGNTGMDAEALRLYPNPTADDLLLITPSDMDDAVISVFNPIGALMYRKTVYFKRIQQIELGSLPNGLYMIRVESINNKKNCYTGKVHKFK